MSLLPPCVCRLGALCDIGVERIGAFATLAGALQDYVSERPILQCEIGIRAEVVCTHWIVVSAGVYIPSHNSRLESASVSAWIARL